MHKFDILDPSLDVFKSRFIEASAGTGKTFAIEHLFVRLLLESEEAISLPEILAVTFTREAAHEMKGRIRAKLTSMVVEGNRRVKSALSLFDEIQVFTIHGFCHRMLSEHAFEASAPLQLSPPDQPDYLYEMRRTVEDFFHTGDPKYAYEITVLMKQSRFDLDHLIGQILNAMQEGAQPEPVHFPILPPITSQELAQDIAALLPRYKRLKPEVWDRQADLFSTFLEGQSRTLLLQQPEWFFEKMIESNVKVRATPISEIFLKNRPFFEALEHQLVPALATFRDKKEMIRRVAAECRRRWEIKARRHDYLTFDDLLHQMKRALYNDLFKASVQDRYKVVIVDEFQDTDPIQWTIFQDLFLEDHLVYLVGDPKQSIYGFRSADIYTYMNAAQALGEESKAYLDTNFRSSPPLITALNDLFTKRPDWIALPSLPGALQYLNVKAGRAEATLDESPLVFFGIKGEIGRERNFPTHSLEEERLFPYIAREIIRLSDRVPFDQMAVLIKDRYHAQRLQSHLNLWKIPSAIKRTFNLAESRGFLEMELFLNALLDPTCESGVKAGMRCCDQNPFYHLRGLFRDKGFAVAFRTYLEDHLEIHGDLQLRREFIQTAELLMEYPKESPSALLSILGELKRESPEIDSRLKLRGEEGEAQVAIMTTFASKGLEFDVVFALAMAYRHREPLNTEQRAEQMRQLYVAFTRAREKLYIPFAIETAGKGRKLAPSPIEEFFDYDPESIDWIEPMPICPYRSQLETFQIAPPPQIEISFEKPFITSFSAMAKIRGQSPLGNRFSAQDLSKKTPHTLPLGSETGTVIHEAFERYFFNRELPLDQIAFETLRGTHLEGWNETISKILNQTLSLELMPNFSLLDLSAGDFFAEMEFLFPEGDHFVKGFADLIFKRGETFYVLDWKTNWVGPANANYTQDALYTVMKEHDYFLQANLYGEAVMRYVKRLYKKSRYGGAYYIFVRGNQVVHIGTS